MISAQKPSNEKDRLASLQELDILDTELEKAYDDITRLAASICDVPICLVSLIDEERQWFKSHHGLGEKETPRDFAFCAHAILQDDIFEVPNALEDDRFFDNPLVVDDPRVIFYAGAVLKDYENYNLGTLCVIDNNPKKLNDFQKESLQILGRQVVSQLELRRHLKKYKHALLRESELNKSQLKFFASMGHEIRTPLNGILGMAQLLGESEDLNKEDHEFANTILNCGKDLLKILNDLLDISKIENEKIDIEEIEFDFVNSVEDIVKLLGAQAKEKGIILKVFGANGFPKRIKGDPLRIKQILINLVSNSIKFSENSEIKITLEHDDKMMHFSVEDQGIGISKEEQKGLFKNFSQASSDTSRKYGGTGLGLSICSRLVSLMGGNIELLSEKGKGTTVKVSIPF